MSDNELRNDHAAGPSAQPVTPAADDSIDVFDLLIVLAKHKTLLVALPLAAAIVGAIVSLLMPSIYTATTRILPPNQGQSTATALIGQLGGLGAGAAAALGVKTPADLFIGMLKSRSVADALIERYDLQKMFNTQYADDTRLALASISSMSYGKDGIIAVSVEHSDAKRAAELANAYVEELHKLNDRLAITEAAKRRLFFEKKLAEEKDSLASAEMDLKRTQEQTGLIKLDEQGRAIIEAVAHVRAQIAAKEVQIGAMRSFATEQNPDRIRAEAELTGLRQQLAKLEQNSPSVHGGTFVPTGKVPEVGLEYVRRLRDVKYHETLFELFAKQYELARVEESRDASVIQVLDRAVPPERRTSPKRKMIVIFAGLAGVFAAVLSAFAHEAYERARSQPERAARLQRLMAYLRAPWRRKLV